MNGEFIRANSIYVECEFTCPKCERTVKDKFPLKPESHIYVETACKCGAPYEILIMPDAGTGTVTVQTPGVDEKTVKARGINK
jgi:transcription elongation factor Elf1